MSEEATVEEYRNIIIPSIEETIQKLLAAAEKQEEGSNEQKALILSAKLNIQEILRIQLHVQYLELPNPALQDEIQRIKDGKEAIQKEFDSLGVDVSTFL